MFARLTAVLVCWLALTIPAVSPAIAPSKTMQKIAVMIAIHFRCLSCMCNGNNLSCDPYRETSSVPVHIQWRQLQDRGICRVAYV